MNIFDSFGRYLDSIRSFELIFIVFDWVLFPVVYLSNSNLVDIKVNFDFNNRVKFIISSILMVVNSVYYDRKLCKSELLELLSLRIGYYD